MDDDGAFGFSVGVPTNSRSPQLVFIHRSQVVLQVDGNVNNLTIHCRRCGMDNHKIHIGIMDNIVFGYALTPTERWTFEFDAIGEIGMMLSG